MFAGTSESRLVLSLSRPTSLPNTPYADTSYTPPIQIFLQDSALPISSLLTGSCLYSFVLSLADKRCESVSHRNLPTTTHFPVLCRTAVCPFRNQNNKTRMVSFLGVGGVIRTFSLEMSPFVICGRPGVPESSSFRIRTEIDTFRMLHISHHTMYPKHYISHFLFYQLARFTPGRFPAIASTRKLNCPSQMSASFSTRKTR